MLVSPSMEDHINVVSSINANVEVEMSGVAGSFLITYGCVAILLSWVSNGSI